MNESSPLVPKESTNGNGTAADNNSDKSLVSMLLLLLQIALVIFFLFGTTYTYSTDAYDSDYSVKEYIAFRDIMAMLLLGFGYLMTFLKNYGLGAVGLTMMLSVISMQLNIAIELGMRFMYKGKDDDEEPGDLDTVWPLPLAMSTLIDSEFCAATLLITFGALIGRASPLQMLIIAISETVFYSFNKVFLVLGYLGSEDVGGSMTIHMFGAFFGLAVSAALGGPKDTSAAESGEPSTVSDVFAFIGTTILWVFWPSFVGATETGVPANEERCVVNTICALLGSTLAAFYVSQLVVKGKFDPVHIANSTLAGGVAIGSGARLDIGPGMALLLGILAGAASVCGYAYSSPMLERKFDIFDTCGVGNLHGIPSVIGGLMSILFIFMDPDASFLTSTGMAQASSQLLGVIATLLVSIASGYATGSLVKGLKSDSTPSYEDHIWWHAEYFEGKHL